MPQVIRTDRAEVDLINILVHLGRHSPAASDHFADAVDRTCQRLAEFPGLGAEREDVPGVHDFTVGHYVLFYRPTDDGIELLRVLGGKQRITRRHFS